MALPGDSILVTPGSGATVATESVSSKEYQVIMRADAYGHIIGGRDVYVTSGVAMSKSASKVYLTLFNADAAKVIEVVYAAVMQEATAAVTGLVRGYRLFRTTSTAPTSGTSVTPSLLRSGGTALDADVTSRKDGVTATASGDPLGVAGVGEEETGAAGAAPHILFAEFMIGEPIILVQNEGVMIVQDATGGTGLLSAIMYFRQR